VGTVFLKDIEQGFGIRRGMRQNARRQRSVACPNQVLAQGVALRST